MGSDNFNKLSKSFGRFYLPTLTLTIVLTSFTMMTYATIVTVAIPNVMGAFGVGQDKAQLMATGFYIAMTVSQLLCAWLLLGIGHYYTYILSLILFTLACLIGAFSVDFRFIILARIIQGTSAGILMSQTMIAVVQAYPINQRGYALSLFTIGGVLAIGFGPVIGGLIIDYMTWRHIFLIPLPLIFLIFLLGIIVMPKNKNLIFIKFDWIGFCCLTTSLYCIMEVFADGQRQGWYSNYIVTLSIIGVLLGIVFISRQLMIDNRILDFTIFKYPVYFAAVLVTFCVGMANFGAIYAIPIFAQVIQTFSPVDAGLIMLPASLLTIVFLPLIAKLSDVISARIGSMIGLACFICGTIPLITADSNTSFLFIMGFVVLTRLGMGINNPFVAKAALSSLPPHKVEEATSNLNFFRLLGTSLGTTAWVVFLEIRTQYHSNSLAFTQTSSNKTTNALLSEINNILRIVRTDSSINEQISLNYLGKLIYPQALSLSFQDGFFIFSLIFIIALLPAYLLGKTKT